MLFRTTLDEYSSALNGITMELLKLISVNLELGHEEIRKMYENGIQGFRINYYPPCPEAEKVLGLTPHSDATGLTLLVQVNEVQGLQIKKNSKWVPIKPVHGSIIVNIGDVMEIMSNGTYKSVEHRAVVDFNNKRLSIVAIHNPDLEVMIGPLTQLLKETTPKYKTMNGVEYIKMILNNKLDGKSNLDQMKI
ncbi:oxoglutarate-dependent flavonoid 7-O-demethylase 1-like [Rutidosis leptorrhynchoides]|uniref:oxoglutarate-dependent flavonoid 7-O-demethylase 1-like n=1 Tax=Rutidosis leptorrhynchoides TaxID=125765 RepID=UPI003A99B2E5